MNYESQRGRIIITDEIDAEFNEIKSLYKSNRVVGFIEDEFKIEHAKAAIEEAYISESKTKYIVLGSKNFNNISQNKLLKIIEEPPKNIEFIIISSSKSTLLPTILSRMPVVSKQKKHERKEINFSLERLDYAKIFIFLKECEALKKDEAKSIVEALFYRATVVDKIKLTAGQLQNFDTAFRLLELNSRAQNVIAMLVMGFAKDKNAT